MDKRLFLAVILSSAVLIIWSFASHKPVKQAISLEKNNAGSLQLSADIKADIKKEENLSKSLPESPESLIDFNTDKVKAVFEENNALIKELIFKDYQSSVFTLINGFELENNSKFKKVENHNRDTLVFVQSDNEKEITKQFIFSNTNYGIELSITIKNLKKSSLIVNPNLILGSLDNESNQLKSRYQDYIVVTQDKSIHPKMLKDKSFNEVQFIGLRDRYFCAIIEPEQIEHEQKENSAFIKKTGNKKSEIGLNSLNYSLLPGQILEQKFRVYIGPQQVEKIAEVDNDWTNIIHYGTFDFISQLLLKLLSIFYRMVHNWGLSIIILSLAIYFLLYPLTLKQTRSMKEMQALQPRIEELRKVYKDNPQKLNKEVMELYKEHKVNPLGGCLPLILQMPIFFALYQALMRCVALKGATFLWIKDLSEPDKLFILPMNVPIIGNEINLLPILMMAGMFAQQKITMKSSVGGSAEQQKIMIIIFPLMFGIIFYHMPAGLVLYWFINSALMLFNQIKASKV
ncbi:MAG: membrane protein insertase YidC [Candidatus Omnitrophota bacterium]